MRPLLVSIAVLLMTYTALGEDAVPQVTIWAYRPMGDNSGLPLTLHMDGRKLTNLGHGQFFGIRVSPGEHTFGWTNQAGAKQVVLPIGPDPETYLKVTFRTNQPFLFIDAVSADTAMLELGGLHPVNRDGIYDLSVVTSPPAIQQAHKAADEEPVEVPEPQSPEVSPPQTEAVDSGAKSEKLNSEKQMMWVTAVNQDSSDANPAHEHNKSLWRVDIVNTVAAENGQVYRIGCTAKWFGSNCAALTDGDKFNAEVDKTTMWINAQKDGKHGKEVRIKYKIIDVR